MKNLIESFRVLESIVVWSIVLPLAGLFELGVLTAEACRRSAQTATAHRSCVTEIRLQR